jgi:hypothetical protein
MLGFNAYEYLAAVPAGNYLNCMRHLHFLHRTKAFCHLFLVDIYTQTARCEISAIYIESIFRKMNRVVLAGRAKA